MIILPPRLTRRPAPQSVDRLDVQLTLADAFLVVMIVTLAAIAAAGVLGLAGLFLAQWLGWF